MYGIDYGIDTVRLGVPVKLNGGELMKNVWRSHTTVFPANKILERPEKIIHTYKRELDLGNAGIKLVYYPQDIYGYSHPLLLIEFSLPIIINGNNIHLLTEPMEAIREVETILSYLPELPKLDLSKADLHRVDITCNFQVNDLVEDYIHQFYKLTYPKRETKPYYPTVGVQFYSQKETLIYYDKREKSKDPSASGILRMEISAIDKRQVGLLLGIKDPTIEILTPGLQYNILDSEMRIVGIKDKDFADLNSALRVLIQAYGREKGNRLHGFLCTSQTNNHKQLELLGFKSDVISKNEKAIKEAGLSMAINDTNKSLPKLEIPK